MPNHITNRLIVEGADKEKSKFFKHIKDDKEERGYIDFNKIIQMPARMSEVESSGRMAEVLLAYLIYTSPTIAFDEEGNLRKKAMFDILRAVESRVIAGWRFVNFASASLLDKPEFQKRGRFEKYLEHGGKRMSGTNTEANKKEEFLAEGRRLYLNILEYGTPTWYEWANKTWGTKWNAYDQTLFDGEIIFHTAWSGVPELMRIMSEQFPELTFHYLYADEDFGSNVGKLKIKNGVMLEAFFPASNSKEALEIAEDLLGSQTDYEDEEEN
jgi:hypothetical protein